MILYLPTSGGAITPPPCTPHFRRPWHSVTAEEDDIPKRQIPQTGIPISLFFSTPTMLSMRAKPSRAILDLTQLNSTKMHSKFLLKTLLLQNLSYLKFIYSEKVTKIDEAFKFNLFLKLLCSVKNVGEFFAALSEFINFTYMLPLYKTGGKNSNGMSLNSKL